MRANSNEELQELCANASIAIEFLPPYCPEFNPIEHSFHDLKSWIRRNIAAAADFEDFGAFLRWAISQVGGAYAARSHFRHAGYLVQEDLH
jgi:transposase